MKKNNMKKESPFEQAGGQSKEASFKRQTVDPKALSEMMNPSNMNYFGATFSFTDF